MLCVDTWHCRRLKEQYLCSTDKCGYSKYETLQVLGHSHCLELEAAQPKAVEEHFDKDDITRNVMENPPVNP